MLRGASRPGGPKRALAGRRTSRLITTVVSGASSAKPMVRKNRPAKLISSERVGTSSRAMPATIAASPPAEIQGSRRRARSSSPERVSAIRGGTPAASQAGTAAEATVASKPASAPFTRLSGGITMPRIVTTK